MAQIILYSVGLLQRGVQLHSIANNPRELNMSGGFNKGNEGTLGIWSELMKSLNPFYFSYAAFFKLQSLLEQEHHRTTHKAGAW